MPAVLRSREGRKLKAMNPGLEDVASHRIARLASKLGDKDYRDAYVSGQLRVWLADQVRALRGDLSQAEFGELIGKPQTVVSRLEDPDYGKLTLQTLLEVASKLDVALVVRFVDHATFLQVTNDFSEAALCPARYNQEAIDGLAKKFTSQLSVANVQFASGTKIEDQQKLEIASASPINQLPPVIGVFVAPPYNLGALFNVR